MQRLITVTIQVRQQQLRQIGADITSALQYRPYGLQQLLGSALLGQIATSACLQNVDGILALGKPTEYQHLGIRIAGADVAQDVEAAAIRHVDVEQHQVPATGAKLVERFVA